MQSFSLSAETGKAPFRSSTRLYVNEELFCSKVDCVVEYKPIFYLQIELQIEVFASSDTMAADNICRFSSR